MQGVDDVEQLAWVTDDNTVSHRPYEGLQNTCMNFNFDGILWHFPSIP